MISDIDLIVFESELNTFSALIKYYEKQQLMLEYGLFSEPDGIFIMEDGESEKSSFKDKVAWIWNKFLKFIQKMCQRVRILVKKIRNSKMSNHIRDKFNELQVAHRRKKYNLPEKNNYDGEIGFKNPEDYSPTDTVKNGKMNQLNKDDILQFIDLENGTIKSFLMDYDTIEKRIQIQYDTLEGISDVLNKYMNQKGYSLADAEKELWESSKASTLTGRNGGASMKYYQYSQGYYDGTHVRFNSTKPPEDVWDRVTRETHPMRDISKSNPIKFADYLKKFNSLESHIFKLDEAAKEVGHMIHKIHQSSVYKNDIVLGRGNGFNDGKDRKDSHEKYPYRPINAADTINRHSWVDPKYRPNRHRSVAGKILDDNELYSLSSISMDLAISMNYITSIYVNMKTEHDALMSLKINPEHLTTYTTVTIGGNKG